MSTETQQTARELLEEIELWGVAEVCEELGTTTGNLARWSNVPQPIMRVRATRLWIADDIRAYKLEREERDKTREPTG